MLCGLCDTEAAEARRRISAAPTTGLQEVIAALQVAFIEAPSERRLLFLKAFLALGLSIRQQLPYPAKEYTPEWNAYVASIGIIMNQIGSSTEDHRNGLLTQYLLEWLTKDSSAHSDIRMQVSKQLNKSH